MAEGKPDFKTLCSELALISHKWLEFGTQLGVPYHKLMLFKKEDDPLLACLNYWREGNIEDSPVSWESIVKALESDHVGENVLAESVREKHCSQLDSKESDLNYRWKRSMERIRSQEIERDRERSKEVEKLHKEKEELIREREELHRRNESILRERDGVYREKDRLKQELEQLKHKVQKNRLSRGDFSQVYRALSSQSYKWFKIGQNLGFTLEELNNIQFSQCMNRHSSDEALEKMLRTWLDWAPNSTDRVHKRRNYPTMDALRQAVVQAGLSDSILSSIP